MPTGIRLNEFMPAPKAVTSSEWVELANQGDAPADLAGWAIDDATGGAAAYTLPAGSTIGAHGLLLVQLPKTMLNNGGDTLRLLDPSGVVADSYDYGASLPDQSFCHEALAWHECQPTPGAPNPAVTTNAGHNQVPVVPTVAAMEPESDSDPSAQLHVDGATHPASAKSFLPNWSRAITASIAPYAIATGEPYQGVSAATPTIRPPAQPAAAPSGPSDLPKPALLGMTEPQTSPLNAGYGIALCALGGAAATYDRLRARGARIPTEEAEDDEGQRE